MAEHRSGFSSSDTAGTPGGVVTIGTSSATVLTATAGRIGAYITNTHATNVLSLSLGGTAVGGSGIVLQPGSTAYINDFTGAINGIASAAGTTVGTAEVGS